MKSRAIATGLAALAATLAFVGSTPAARETKDPLVGTWQTLLIPLAKVSATLSAHGYTATQIDNFLHKNGHYVKGLTIRIRFYRDSGAPFQIVYSWDPRHGSLPTATTALTHFSQAIGWFIAAPIPQRIPGARRLPTR
jgi:hypothetical protein